MLLHGGLVDACFFEPNLGPLAAVFHVYTPERRGQSHTPDIDGPVTYQLMAGDAIALLDEVVGTPADSHWSTSASTVLKPNLATRTANQPQFPDRNQGVLRYLHGIGSLGHSLLGRDHRDHLPR